MTWIQSRQFQLVKMPDRHYVFRRDNSGNTEINVPKTVQTKIQARNWLAAHPNAPKKFKSKKKPTEVRTLFFINKNTGQRKPVNKAKDPNFLLNTKRAKGENIPWNFTCDLRRQLKVFTPLGKGRQGIVFKGSRYSNGRYPFAIKIAPKDLRAEARKEIQPAKVEFDIQSAVQNETPGVVRVYQMIKCSNFITPNRMNMPNVQNSKSYDKADQAIILMEYCAEGSLKSWLEKQKSMTDTTMRGVIWAVLTALERIRRKYPDFRHNDLHIENIFMSSDRGPLIGDFGWARLKKMGTNPAVNTANGTSTASFWGVGPETLAKYDHHLFLNELREWVKRQPAGKLPQTLAFLNYAVPDGYRGQTTTHVSKWRLKYGDPCPDLPGLTKLVSSSYISGPKLVTSANLVRAKDRLRKPRDVRAPVKPVNRKAYTNQELINMAAANFIRLSPVTRARAKNLRAKFKVKMNKVKAPVPKVNLTARVKKAPSPVKKRKPFPREVLKTNKFNKMVTKIYTEQGGGANEAFSNAWNRARTKAMNIIQNRVNRSLPPLSPSPPKPKPKAPSPPKPKPKVKPNHKLSPESGRLKIKAPNSGRYVYANGATIPMNYLKNMARNLGINIKGVRSKANIASKIFKANNK